MGVTASNNSNACHECGTVPGGETTSLFLGNYPTLDNLSSMEPAPEPGSYAYITVPGAPDDLAVWDQGDGVWRNIGQNNIGRVLYNTMPGSGSIQLADVLAFMNASILTVEPFHAPIYYKFTRFDGNVYKTNVYSFLGGKGKWGTGGTTITSGHLNFISRLPTAVDDISEDTIIELGTIEEGGFIAAANSVARDLTDDTRPYYFSYVVGSTLTLALFIGEDYQVYGGESLYQFEESHFAFVTSNEVEPTPTYQDTLAAGNQTTLDAVHKSGTKKTKYSGAGTDYSTDESGNTIAIRYAEPVEDVEYTIPAKPTDDTFAMVSDLENFVELGETSSTAYRGDRGKIAYDFSQFFKETVVAIGGTINNQATPTNLLRFTNQTTPVILSGLANPVDGKGVVIINNTLQNIDILNESASSSEANRFINNNAQDLFIVVGGAAQYVYSSTLSRWVLINIWATDYFASLVGTTRRAVEVTPEGFAVPNEIKELKVWSATTLALSKATLNTTHPDLTKGQQVVCPYVTGGAKIYEKFDDASGDWLTINATITV